MNRFVLILAGAVALPAALFLRPATAPAAEPDPAAVTRYLDSHGTRGTVDPEAAATFDRTARNLERLSPRGGEAAMRAMTG